MYGGLIVFGLVKAILQVSSAVRTFTVAVFSLLRPLKHEIPQVVANGEPNLNSNPGVFKDYGCLSKYEKQLDLSYNLIPTPCGVLELYVMQLDCDSLCAVNQRSVIFHPPLCLS